MVDIDSKRFIVAVNIDNGSLIPGNNEIFCVAVPSVEFGVGSCYFLARTSVATPFP
jgi:hypothetical protein